MADTRMVNMKIRNIVFSVMMTIMSVFSVATLIPISSVDAAGPTSCPMLLIFKPWYCNLEFSGTDIKQPTSDNMPKFIWTIVGNMVDNVFRATGLLATGFLIWGGYQYMLGQGEPGKLAGAKKTITNAIIGLVISILASSIVNVFMRIIL